MPKTTTITAAPVEERDAKASDQWLAAAREQQATALDAARLLVELVDDVVPFGGPGSRRRSWMGGAFRAADGLAKMQFGLFSTAVNGMTFVNVAVDVNAFNGTDVDVNVDTDVDADIASREPLRVAA